MLNFRTFITALSENFSRGYEANDAQFKELYDGHRLVRDGLTTHVFNSFDDKIATYNHEMGVLSTNRQHSHLKEI